MIGCINCKHFDEKVEKCTKGLSVELGGCALWEAAESITKAGKLTKTDKKVLVAFANNNMSVSGTGRALYMGHTTISYHLKRIEQKTGFSPYKFYELLHLLRVCLGEESV